MTPAEQSHAAEAICRLAPVVPVLVIDDLAHAAKLAAALVAGGLPALEVTLRTPVALDAIRAMAEVPRFAGTAAGVGVFMQNFFAALFAQLYGMLADGTPGPMSAIALTGVTLCLICGATPFVLKRWRGS